MSTTTDKAASTSSTSLATAGGVVDERDAVYLEEHGESGDQWCLVLERTTPQPERATTRLYVSDVLGTDGPLAVFAVPSAKSHFADRLDLVTDTGAVTLSSDLGGGFGAARKTGEVDLYTPKADGKAFGRVVLTQAPAAVGWTVRSTTGEITPLAARRLSAGQLWVEPKPHPAS